MSPAPRDREALAAVVCDNSAARGDALARALEAIAFWGRLDALRRGRRKARKAMHVLIKPDLDVFDRAASTGTDPRLVEHLIDLLHGHGFTHVDVAAAPGRADLWAENREVAVLADLAGYRWVTDQGHAYDVLDLGEDLVTLPPRPGGVLGEGAIARAWRDADVRIGFAHNRTDEEEGYTLGLGNLLGVLPLRDKDYHYRHRLPTADVVRDLLDLLPVHLALIDAWTSNHGPAGRRRATPLPTRTIVAADHLLLGDWVGALKMGLDPYVSRPHATLLREGRLPARHRIEGSLEPYPGWRNVPVLLRDSVRARNCSPQLAAAVEPWLQQLDTDLFPFRRELDERVNALLAPVTGDRPLELTALTAVNFWLGGLVRAAESGRILVARDDVRRRTTALGFDPAAYAREDYDAAADLMLPLADLARQTPPDRNGLRWRYLDRSVLFEYRQVVERPFDAWVARVDIARAVESMNDNIGGARVPVAHDRSGRVIRQAERDIYLPQPNWIVLFGGEAIDVGKLDVIRYEEDRQQIFWRTVTSANGSAEYDDGIVTFARAPGDHTTITIVARQKFARPPAIEALRLDRFPQLEDTLVSEAYTTFFARTVANFVATYEGRDPRLGRPWDPRHGEPDATDGQGPVALIVDAVRQLATLLEPWLARTASGPQGGVTDADGFQHFQGAGSAASPSAPVAGFLSDLLAALRRDLAWRDDTPTEDRP